MKSKYVFFSLTLIALLVSACASATPAPAPATSAPVLPVTGPATSTPLPAPASGAMINVGQDATLGSFLVDSKGMSLYIFTKDTANTSNCSGTCADNWPPLVSNGAPVAGSGVNASLLGVIARADGSSQVTYNNMPLYYFAADKAPGDVKGQAVKSVWYVLDPSGKSITTAPAGSAPAPSSSSGALVNVGQNSALGSFLVDSKGMTLYLFTKDTPNTSTCYGGCAKAWPPLLATGAPSGGAGVNAALLGTTARTDGTMQVTYNGWPLYYWAKDKAAGDTTGQGVQSVWYVIDPAGKAVTAAPAAAAPAPSASSGALINIGQSSALGSFLVDSKGMTLYLFTKDTPNVSNCSGGCLSYWPPLLTSGAPVAGSGVNAAMLSTTKRSDGSMQVTYNGWPLYYYVSDKAAGDTTGENVQSVWFVITPAGVQK